MEGYFTEPLEGSKRKSVMHRRGGRNHIRRGYENIKTFGKKKGNGANGPKNMIQCII